MKRDEEEAKQAEKDDDATDHLTGGAGEDTPGGGSGEDKASDKPWENHPNPDFRAAIAGAVNSDKKPNHGYDEVNKDTNALGRYQLTPSGLKAAGWKESGKWTELAKQNGVTSDKDFLTKPEAQEKALTAYLTNVEQDARRKGIFAHVGKTYKGVLGEDITVTEAGLMAALHRGSRVDVTNYFKNLEALGGNTNGNAEKLTKEDKYVETRLRTFQMGAYSGTSAKR